MLIEIYLAVNNTSQIILNIHVDCIFQCHDLKHTCVRIVCFMNRIIQTKQLLRLSEDHPKQRVFVLSLCRYKCTLVEPSSQGLLTPALCRRI